MSANTASGSSTSGTLTAVPLTLQPGDGEARVVLTGPYTGAQGTIDGTMADNPGTTDWVNLNAQQESNGSPVSGTLNPGSANLSYVVKCRGWKQVRFNPTQVSTGTLSIRLDSANSFGGGTAPAQGSAAGAITSASATAFQVGPNGGTNPTFNVDASTASAATGLNVKSAAAGSGLALSVTSSGTNEALKVDAKGSGAITIGGTSTGVISIGRGSVSMPVFSSTKTTVATQNSTPTAAQLLGGYIDHNSTTGAGTATLDTGTNIDAAIAGVANGDSFQCIYVNRGSQTVTITTNTGLTLRGTAAIPSGKNAILDFFRTGAATWDVAITLSA